MLARAFAPRPLTLALLAVLACLPTPARAQEAGGADGARVRTAINDGWRFLPRGISFGQKTALHDEDWTPVTLPHTWNAADPFDDAAGYVRGTAWYRRRLALGPELRGKRIFLHFEGANQVADVFVNGAFAGRHDGGYTAFTVDVTRFVRFGAARAAGTVSDVAGAVTADVASENVIAVQVSNAHDPFIAPLNVGFALYGGLYRDVWLVAAEPVHFTLADHGGPGLYVTTPGVTAARGAVAVRGRIDNADSLARRVRVVHTLRDPDGREVARAESAHEVASGASGAFESTLPAVENPRLWSPEAPVRYRLTSEVFDGARRIDRAESPVGFRFYRFDAAQGFFLNGAKYTIRGTNRHQDRAGFGSALSNVQHVADLEAIKAMGANFLRLAHYPQDPAVLEAADRLGLLIWEEVPVVDYITVDPRFTAGAQRMLREMIRQHHNHPSVIMWGTMNEPFLYSEQGARIAQHTDRVYGEHVRRFAVTMDSTARAEDPSRVTTMAIHGSNWYETTGVEPIPDVLGLNLYSGWYSGTFDGLGRTLDRRHAEHPEQVMFISEYGSGSDERLNSLAPVRFDHSTQWHRLYHESYLKQFAARPYLAGTAIWNQYDFSQPDIGETFNHMNKKGMATFDRRPKDVYYLYKANWHADPLVYIASREWTSRSVETDADGGLARHPIDVYSNLDRVELVVNGRSAGTVRPDSVRKASWSVLLRPGANEVVARATRGRETITDALTIHAEPVPYRLADAPFAELRVDVGATTQFRDEANALWIEDRPYRAGAFGYVGEGATAFFNRNTPILGAAGPNGTQLYHSVRTGLDGYRADVPDGDYAVELHFIEPDVAGPGAAPGARVFGVAINGETAEARLDLVARAGVARVLVRTFTARAEGGRGLDVRFPRITGAPTLAALRITRR